MTQQQTQAFNTLIEQWARHQDLRRTGAPIAELYSSRCKLDVARSQARRR